MFRSRLRQFQLERKVLDKYPPDGWLKGYFYINEPDVIGGDRSEERCWKNTDYLRLKDFALSLLNPQPSENIIDVGCGDGAMMVYCGLQGATVYGLDLDERHVAEANRDLRRFGIQGEARCGDARRLDFPDNFFDGAISGDFMEHVTDDVKVAVLREVKRCLKPGALLVIKTPNLRYLKVALLYKRLRAISRLRNPWRYTIAHSPGTDDPQHIGLTTRPRLTLCLLQAGFLNYKFHYAPLRRLGFSSLMETLSVDIWGIRDFLCEDLFCVTWKPIIASHFPD
jgi:SAM-dependent methyltransferase